MPIKLTYGAFIIDSAPVVVLKDTLLRARSGSAGTLALGDAFGSFGKPPVFVHPSKDGAQIPVTQVGANEFAITSEFAQTMDAQSIWAFSSTGSPVDAPSWTFSSPLGGFAVQPHRLCTGRIRLEHAAVHVGVKRPEELANDLISDNFRLIAGVSSSELLASWLPEYDELSGFSGAWMESIEGVWRLRARFKPGNIEMAMAAAGHLASVNVPSNLPVLTILPPTSGPGGTDLVNDPVLQIMADKDAPAYVNRLMEAVVSGAHVRTPMRLPLQAVKISSDEVAAQFDQTRSLPAAMRGEAAPLRIESLPRFAARESERPLASDAVPEFHCRPVRGTIVLRTRPQATGAPRSDGPNPLGPGEHRVEFEGEVSPSAIPDQTNRPIRLYSEKLILGHKADAKTTPRDTRPFTVSTEKEVYEYLFARAALLIPGAARVDVDTHLNGLAFGDVQLKLVGAGLDRSNPGTRTSTRPFGQAVFVSKYAPTGNGEGLWRFYVEQAVKTPFRGASSGLLQQRLGASAAEPRTERYSPAPGREITPFLAREFRSDGSLISAHNEAGGSNVLFGFQAERTSARLMEPANSALQFLEGTVLARTIQPITSLRADSSLLRRIESLATMNRAAGPDDPACYTSIEVRLVLPPVPGEVQDHYESPTLVWKETLPQPMRNDRVRGIWSPKIDASRYLALLKNNGATPPTKPPAPPSEGHPFVLPAGMGLGASFPLEEDGNAALIFEACSQENPTDPAPLRWVATDQIVPTAEPAVGKVWAPVKVATWWRDLLEPGSAGTGDLTPLDARWRGLLAFDAEVASPVGLPENFRKLLNTLRCPLAYWDRNVCSYVIDHEVDLNDRKSTEVTSVLLRKKLSTKTMTVKEIFSAENKDAVALILGRTRIKIKQGRVELLELQFWWNMPYFSQSAAGDPTWVQICGSWERGNETRRGQLVLFASLPDGCINVGWLGIDKLRVDQIKVIHSGDAPDLSKGQWRIGLDGSINFSDKGVIPEWFDLRLKTLRFTGMSFSIEHPWSDFSLPEFKIDNPPDLKPKGFDFKFKGFQLKNPSGPDDKNRAFRILGDLTIGIPFLDFLESGTVGAWLQFSGDLTGLEPEIEFGFDPSLHLRFKLYKFMHVDTTLTWLPDEERFGAVANVLWRWSDDSPSAQEFENGFKAFFQYGSKKAQRRSPDKFWVVGLQAQSSQSFDLGFMKASGVWLIAGHRATLPASDGMPALRDAVMHTEFASISRGLSQRTLDQWEFTNEFNWFVGFQFSDLELKGFGSAIAAKDVVLFLSDDGVFRGRFSISAVGVKMPRAVELALDWKNFAIGGNIGLPDIKYGAYELDLGEIGFFFGSREGAREARVDWGYPYNRNWERSLKLRWNPPPWPIPINTVQGGVLIGFRQFSGVDSLTVGVAVRVGYSFVLGSDGGAFGACISGEIMIGAVTEAIIDVQRPRLVHHGMVTVDADARGGVIVFGLKWDIIKVWVHMDTGFTLIIAKGAMSASFFAHFEAGFEVCLTPCTCIGGSIGFSYNFGASSSTDHQWPEESRVRTRSLKDVSETASIEEVILQTMDVLSEHNLRRERVEALYL